MSDLLNTPAHPEASAPTPISHGVAKTLARHPRPLGGDPLKRADRPVLSLTGMVLNNIESPVHQLTTKKKPDWLRAKVPGGPGYTRLRGIMDEHRLVTVCQGNDCTRAATWA